MQLIKAPSFEEDIPFKLDMQIKSNRLTGFHTPRYTEGGKGRHYCVICATRTHHSCATCDKPMCISTSDKDEVVCWNEYHQISDEQLELVKESRARKLKTIKVRRANEQLAASLTSERVLSLRRERESSDSDDSY
ncbi:MAG: hypothetical protein Q8Q69_06440 [Nitrosopumilaceae archaeon]|nr:hypothetical protein [Nitrosopumilaceae archaeon]